MCDVTTAMFVINHTSVEILGWVMTRLVTALQMYYHMMTIRNMTRDAAHHPVQVTARSPLREMCDVTTAVFVNIQHTSVEILRWDVTRLVTALQMYFPGMTITMMTRDAAHHQAQVAASSPVGEM